MRSFLLRKPLSVLLITALAGLTGCHTKDPLPADTWSEDCVQLSPVQGGYKLSGLCCAYLNLPVLNLSKGGTFTVNGTYFTFTGAGFAPIATVVDGKLSDNGKQLTIAYTVNQIAETHVLKPGVATATCDYCKCD
ncbi:hypothetical protein [Arsenicibacter rosenii]|uniref:Lipoprotein n=1 Tax=Arsenicibacter rosenii TaxID=1750698 RepID=A0A1S2VDA5_9BACT|nr:hypothetical protein [Arsenicibacter rosenii]OIN55908.1 hypothetical protein BLX24_27545 [Arsenicibacter rosenii]